MNKIERLVENLANLKGNLDRLRAAIANNTRTDEINACYQITRDLQAIVEAINNPNNLTLQERANLRRLLNSLLAEEYGDDQEKALINAIKRDVNLLLD